MEVFDVTTVSWLVGRDAAVNWELVTTSTKHYCIILPNVLLWHRWDSGKLLRVLASMRQTKAHFVFESGKVKQAEFNNGDGLSHRFFFLAAALRIDPKTGIFGYYSFNANILFTIQAIKDLYAHITYPRFWLFLQTFWWFLGTFEDK